MTVHDCHVSNMAVMFKTWLSCCEHGSHVQNITVRFQNTTFMFQNTTVMFWNMTVMFQTWQSCFKHDCHVCNMTVMFWTWLPCSKHDSHVLSCSKHDCHVRKMTVMFETWQSGLKHDSHVLSCFVVFQPVPTILFMNITAMFEHHKSCSEHDLSCSEHDLSCSHIAIMFSHVHSCSKKNPFAKLKWCIIGFEHPTICIDTDSANHFTQGRFWKYQSGKGTLSVNRLMLNFRLRTWSDATPLKEALSIHCKHTAYVSGALEKKCYVTYVPFMHAKDTL